MIISKEALKSKIEGMESDSQFGIHEFTLTCQRKEVASFKRYMSEVFVLKSYEEETRMLINAPTNTGKTSTVIKQALAKHEWVIILCSELIPAMQVAKEYGLPIHWSGNKIDPNTKQLVTIYNHLPYFQNKGKPKHTVILDEVHALVTDAYRDDTIKAMVRSLAFFKVAYCLTGTLIESRFFNHYYLFEGKPETSPIQASLVRYENDIAAVTKMTSHYVLKENKQVMIYLQDLSTKLPKLIQALTESGISSITLLNSDSIRDLGMSNGQSVIDNERFDTEVLITTYRQSYNLQNEDLVYICFPNTDVVSIAQSIVRARKPLHKAFILSNANKDELEWSSTYKALYAHYEGLANELIYYTQNEGYNNDQITAYLDDDENGKLIQYNQTIDHLAVAYQAYRDANGYMAYDRKLLVTALAKFNVEIFNEYYDKSSKLDLAKVKTSDETYLEDITEVLDAIEYKTSYRGLDRKLISKVFEYAKLEPDYSKVREFFLNEYRPGCRTFNKKLSQLRFKSLTGMGNYATFKRILEEKVDTTQTFSLEALQELVREVANISGAKIGKGNEMLAFESLFNRERTSTMIDGIKKDVYAVSKL
jgi:hypothetical protein